MQLVVQKYGGSSVATLEKMNKIADAVIKRKEEGVNVVIVVSAMGKTTNNLIEMAKSISEQPPKRELDMLMATGEQVSISLLSMVFQEKGYDSVSLTGFQAGIKTEGVHTKNKISEVDVDKIKRYLEEDKIVVVAGFQGMNTSGDITTLGRGGSDTTAVALAAKLKCVCEIYTDVDGIYSVDPRLFPNAKRLDFISYEEMMEMSCLGAKVMEARSVELAYKYNVPIYVASSHQKGKGTYIKEFDKEMEHKVITGLTVSDDVLMETINKVPYSSENISDIFSRLASQEVNIDMISQTSSSEGYVNISFTTSKEDESTVDAVMKEFAKKVPGVEVKKDTDITKISVVGMGMRNESGVASKIFKLFSDNSINFKQVTTSEISISYIINSSDKEKAVNIICETFKL
ncbi:MAG: aspartate kinase [Clostridiales bacterium]|nr:aspartate kinase [Clostridiales bacterium]